jgi:hypothetical protein
MDHAAESATLRSELTAAQRTAKMRMAIDPGFVHHRKIETVLGPPGMEFVNRAIREVPANAPEHMRQLQIDHIYTRSLLALCDAMGVPTLAGLIGNEQGRLFCSTEEVLPAPGVYEDERATSEIALKGSSPVRALLEYTTKHIAADTTKSQLANGSEVAVIAELGRKDGDVLTFEPLVIGAPWLEDSELLQDAVWFSYSYGEIFIEDVDEFSKVVRVDTPSDISVMSDISESAVKQCIAELLGVDAPKDWGGEQSDLYSSHVHLRGRRTTAAFLLKGPARFAPMGLNALGKNNDQIVRLSHEPAELLVVQHCHDILQPVRETLRAFTIRPGGLGRRYCLIDGRDTLRLLRAYDKVERALDLSK